MGGIQGLGGVNGPSPERPAEVRDRKRDDDVKAPPSGDGVQISSSAQEAANTARLVQLANNDSGVRADKVEAARQAIERGDFKIPGMIAEVARRISRYL